MTQSFGELFLGGVRQCANEGKQYLPCFGLWFECRTPCHNHLHVEMTHLEWNTLKYRDISTEAIAGDGENGVSQLFKKQLALVIVRGTFLIHVLPPEVFFCIGIAKEYDTPCGIIRALAKVCGINHKVDWSWSVRLLWNDDRINNRDECLSVVTSCIRQLTDCLFMKDVCEPEIVMIDRSTFITKSSRAVIATPRLESSFFPSFFGVS